MPEVYDTGTARSVGASRRSRRGDGHPVVATRALAGRVQELDEALFRRVSEWHSPLADRTMGPLSEAASYSRLWVIIAALLALVGGRRGRRTAIEGLVAVGMTSALANIAVKGLTRRRRPVYEVPEGRRLRQPDSSSFPSGHTASAAAFSGVVGNRSAVLRLPISALAATVGFSRIYTGVHYPGDVVAGWILGRAVSRVVCWIGNRFEVGRP